MASGGSGTSASLPYTVRHQRVLPRYCTPQIVLFDSYDKFMSILKCHFCPYCHTECLREAEKPGPLANFDDC